MKAEKLKRAAVLFERITAIDKELSEIEKLAGVIASGKGKPLVTVSCEVEPEKKVTIDEDGSLNFGVIHHFHLSMIERLTGSGTSTESKTDTRYSHRPSEGYALRVLSLLAQELSTERTEIMVKLSSIGVQI